MELRAVAAGALVQRTTLPPQRRIALGIGTPQILVNNATTIGCCFKSSGHQTFLGSFKRQPLTLQLRATRGEGASVKSGSRDESRVNANSGTVLGAASLIIGTSIGSGILLLPEKTSPAGFLPSTVSIIICWAFLVVEALMVAEVNVSLTRMRRESWKDEVEENAHKEEEETTSPTTISFKTMAQETLGELGGSLATITYIFLGYTSMIAYASESGEILSKLIALPPSSLSILFTVMLASLVFFGGTQITDGVNQWLTVLMLGLLVTIEVTAASSGDWLSLMAVGDWRKVPRAVPVIIFALVYHDIIPVVCSYLDGDLKRIRLSIWVGSLIPVVFLLAWDGIVLGYSSRINVVDPLELLLRGGDAAASTMAETFSILAVGTSLIGTLLGFSNFFQEQFYSIFRPLLLPQVRPLQITSVDMYENNISRSSDGNEETGVLREWLHLESVLNFSSVAMAVIPPLVISTTIADAFSVATDIAGGYCMTLLYGILPPAMAWSLRMQQIEVTREESNAYVNEHRITNEEEGERAERTFFDKCGRGQLSDMKPALMGTGLFATVLMAEQLFEDVRSLLHL